MSPVIIGAWRTPPAARPGKILVDLYNRTISRGEESVRLSPGELMFVVVLLCAAGTTLEKKQLMEVLYGDREDGGPLDKVLDVHLCRARRSMKPLGIRFDTVWGRGICAFIDMPEAAE